VVTQEEEVNQIIKEMKDPLRQGDATAKLYNFLQKNPHLYLDYFLRNQEDSFVKNIKNSLERYKSSLSDSGSTPIP